LNPIEKDRQVSERIAALERASKETNTLWVNPLRRSAIVLLQDHAHPIGEAVDGYQKSMTTMYSIMLRRNPPPESFKQLLDIFRTS
jgi:hypothetical protein